MTYSPNAFHGYSGTSKSTGSNFQNGLGVGLAKGTPVSLNSFSQIVNVDVSNEASVLALIGVTGCNIPSGATGGIMDTGRLEDIPVSFSYGDPIYVAKDGTLTNLKPSIGVGGFAANDFVIFLGVIVKNEFNPLLKDLKLMVAIVGQL